MALTVHQESAWNRMPSSFPVDGTYRFRINAETGRRVPGSGYLLQRTAAPLADWTRITQVVMHYTADDNLIDGDPGEVVGVLPLYINSIHQMYARQRGYSIGYNFIVDYLGGIWVGRGWELRNAANAEVNSTSFSILCLVDGADTTTEAADRSIRWLVGEGQLRTQRQLAVKGHQEVGATACPGVGIMTKIREGRYSPSYSDTNTPWTPRAEEDSMTKLIRITDSGQQMDLALFFTNGTIVEWCATQQRADSLSFMGELEHAGVKGSVPAIGIPVDRGFLQYFTLLGVGPVYPPSHTGPRTSPADFARWVT